MSEAAVKLACRGVWKLFGPHARAFLERHAHRPDPAALRAAGLVAAVRAVDLEIRTGEIFIIMGLSGSGKSTLVRCLSRLIEPTAGAVLFDGRDLLGASEREMMAIRRHRMGMVFQHFALLPHRSVLGNVAFPLEVQGIARAERERRARAVIELVGLAGREHDYPRELAGREHDYPRELSGGQQQRVGIARSLAVEPELWFLDEPFSALDPLIRREMQDEFLRLQSVLHKTIVFITHDFDEAIRLADRIAIMKDGAVIQVGTPEQLMLDPADAYVAEFTRDVLPAKVLTAATLMVPLDGVGEFAGSVAAGERIAAIAERVEAAERPFAVTDAEGRPIGRLDRQRVIDVLVGRGVRR